jgi:hypothetical protein
MQLLDPPPPKKGQISVETYVNPFAVEKAVADGVENKSVTSSPFR